MTTVNPFEEVQFPVKVGMSSTGGPMRQTQIVSLGSGGERRNARWTNSRRKYSVVYFNSDDEIHSVLTFFEAMNARLIGFRLKDWADYKSCAPLQTVTPLDQTIGHGDGATKTFQLIKTYTKGTRSSTRNIKKPVSGTVRVAVGGVEQLTGWSVDTTTGIVTFVTAPALTSPATAITAGFEFDVPVRFDTDYLEINMKEAKAGIAQNVPMIEDPLV